MTDHRISIVTPIYNQRERGAVCTCGWASPELPSAGQATIAGYTHIREAKPKERSADERVL